MRKLLVLYKDCRFLDKLMGTTYFHEDHFLVSSRQFNIKHTYT